MAIHAVFDAKLEWVRSRRPAVYACVGWLPVCIRNMRGGVVRIWADSRDRKHWSHGSPRLA